MSNKSAGQVMGKEKMPPKLRLKLANDCQDLLSRVELKPLIKGYKFFLVHSKQVDVVTYDRLMILFESLMKDAYEKSSWGWDAAEKLAEWKHSRTWIMIVTKDDGCDPSESITSGRLPDEDEEIIGFMCIRFETGADKNECSLYVYELHVETDYQRQGLGKELMRMAQVLGLGFKMDKIMLTVFRSNAQAIQFYNKLKFSPDKSSPSKAEADYTILSSKLVYTRCIR